MVQTPQKRLTLEAFLAIPETKPASEFIDGQIIQKPMPQVAKNIAHCLDHGTQMGWLIDPEDKTVVVSPHDSRSRTFEVEAGLADPRLPVPDWAMNLELTLGELFSWLAG
jgi:Uma2 family endonuclease